MAQRLLRRICKVCNGSGKDPAHPDEKCDNCFGTGFRGRVAVYEIMEMTDELRRLTGQSADTVTLKDAAIAAGFQSMHEDANLKVARGLTTAEEVNRVLF
jgi:general secretion pathway protein E